MCQWSSFAVVLLVLGHFWSMCLWRPMWAGLGVGSLGGYLSRLNTATVHHFFLVKKILHVTGGCSLRGGAGLTNPQLTPSNSARWDPRSTAFTACSNLLSHKKRPTFCARRSNEEFDTSARSQCCKRRLAPAFHSVLQGFGWCAVQPCACVVVSFKGPTGVQGCCRFQRSYRDWETVVVFLALFGALCRTSVK